MESHVNEVPAGSEQGELRIVVGVDGSEGGNQAVDFAAHEAARWGAVLHVVSAYEVEPTAGWVVMPLEPYEENAVASVDAALSRIHELEPDVVTKGEHIHGFAGNVLVAASEGIAAHCGKPGAWQIGQSHPRVGIGALPAPHARLPGHDRQAQSLLTGRTCYSALALKRAGSRSIR